ncbi:MAG: hypothetical protein ACFB10_03265, partial [Salibacteraceae bacterium]
MHGNTLCLATLYAWQHFMYGNTLCMATPQAGQHQKRAGAKAFSKQPPDPPKSHQFKPAQEEPNPPALLVALGNAQRRQHFMFGNTSCLAILHVWQYFMFGNTSCLATLHV